MLALFPGSFDPVTNGHADVLETALAMADKVIIAIGENASKKPLLSLEERKTLLCAMAEKLNALERVQVIEFSGLVIEAARQHKAAVIIRGLRDTTDFAYEMQMAGMNSAMAPEIKTVFLPAKPETRHISSTLVRQIVSMGGDISSFVPKDVVDIFKTKRH
jgi:pantetheine-phosphate adenylyltransferase